LTYSTSSIHYLHSLIHPSIHPSIICIASIHPRRKVQASCLASYTSKEAIFSFAFFLFFLAMVFRLWSTVVLVLLLIHIYSLGVLLQKKHKLEESSEIIQIQSSGIVESSFRRLGDRIVDGFDDDNGWVPVSPQERLRYPTISNCTHKFQHCCIGQSRVLTDQRRNMEPLFQKWRRPLSNLTHVLNHLSHHQNKNSDTCNLWFLGDSLSADHSMAAMCELTAADSGYELVECVGPFGGKPFGESHKCESQKTTKFSFPHFLVRSTDPSNIVCPDVLIRYNDPVTSGKSMVHDETFLESGGVALWNWGMHCNEHGNCIAEWMDKYLSSFLKLVEGHKKWSVLWRETEPQHFHTDNGLFRPGMRINKKPCRMPVSENLSNFRNTDAAVWLSSKNWTTRVPIVPIFNALKPKWDFHSDNSGDCTHYCYTPWRFHLTWDGMLKGLQSLQSVA
jgi:hypothetical protein